MELIRDAKGRIVENRWSEEELTILRTMYRDNTNAEIAKILGCHGSTVWLKAQRLGLEKSKEIKQIGVKNLLVYGEKYRFKKGRIPETKGRKQTEWMSQQSIENSKKGRFKKGNIPNNHKQVGYERVSVDGYVEVKTKEPRTFKLKHRLVWEKENGAIPRGYNIQFRDGNRLNCSIENLYMISRRDQVRQNSIVNYPSDLQRSIRLLGKLKKTIKNTN